MLRKACLVLAQGPEGNWPDLQLVAVTLPSSLLLLPAGFDCLQRVAALAVARIVASLWRVDCSAVPVGQSRRGSNV